jgi:hypothetical protein
MNGLKCKPMIGSQLSGGINRKRVVITKNSPAVRRLHASVQWFAAARNVAIGDRELVHEMRLSDCHSRLRFGWHSDFPNFGKAQSQTSAGGEPPA